MVGELVIAIREISLSGTFPPTHSNLLARWRFSSTLPHVVPIHLVMMSVVSHGILPAPAPSNHCRLRNPRYGFVSIRVFCSYVHLVRFEIGDRDPIYRPFIFSLTLPLCSPPALQKLFSPPDRSAHCETG